MAPRVLVLGATGMLGSAVLEELGRSEIETIIASRTQGILFNAEEDKCEEVLKRASLRPGDFVVNCVGLTKKFINEEDSRTIERAVKLNVIFPIDLARSAGISGVRVIQVATDCVFSGEVGHYTELSSHDARDAYGKTKSLGEVVSENVMHLRCSLVGPESNGRNSLFFEWVRGSPKNSTLSGFVNHKWNGLTSKAFGKLVSGLIRTRTFSPGVQHLVPSDSLTKHELVKLELEFLGRGDVTLIETLAEHDVDRTLSTGQMDFNRELFQLAGYSVVPTIRDMMEELPWEQLILR